MTTSPAQLTFDDKNANKGSVRGDAMLERSLQQYGAGRSALADRNGVIIAGNKTVGKALELGIPVREIESDGKTLFVIKRTDLDIDTPEGRELAVADNRVGEVSLTWDADVLSAFQDDGIDLSQFWFEDELADLLAAEEEVTEGLTAPDDVPDVPDEPITKPGDVWVLGRHRICCADSTLPETADTLLSGAHVDLVFTDPPYGVSAVGSDGKIGADNIAKNRIYAPVIGDETTQTAQDFYTLWSQISDRQIIWGGNYFTSFLPFSDGWVIWDKRGEMASNNFADGEMAWCSFHTPVRIFKQVWARMIREGESEERVPPTQKPVQMLADVITRFTEPGAIVVDGFLGSGSTLLACEQTGRTCYGVELSPVYVDVCVRRWEQFTGSNAVRETEYSGVNT